jgi:transcriptional regulator with XRE-family HTH domain
MTVKRLSTAIRQLRETRGMTQLELAKKAKVAQGYISSLEAGEKKNPSVKVLRKLAKALGGVPVVRLLE